LTGRRIPQYREHYEGRVRRGDIVVSVHCDDPQWTKKALVILKRAGAADIASATEVTTDFMKPSQPVRPLRERTITPPLRLVVNRSIEEAGKVRGATASSPEPQKRSVAS
jgi:hypothetical protein